MVEVAAEVDRAFRLPAPLEVAWALLADVPRWARLYPHVESVEPLPGAGPGVYRTTMEPLGPPGVGARVVYACRYVPDPEACVLRWTPVAGVGNARFAGEAALRSEAGATAGALRLGAVLSIPAPSWARAVVEPAVRWEVARMTDVFLDRLRHAWGGSAV